MGFGPGSRCSRQAVGRGRDARARLPVRCDARGRIEARPGDDRGRRYSRVGASRTYEPKYPGSQSDCTAAQPLAPGQGCRPEYPAGERIVLRDCLHQPPPLTCRTGELANAEAQRNQSTTIRVAFSAMDEADCCRQPVRRRIQPHSPRGMKLASAEVTLRSVTLSGPP